MKEREDDARERIVVQLVQAPPDELIDRPSVVEVQAWSRLLSSGRLPFVRIGRKRLVRRSDLLALVDEQEEPEDDRSTDSGGRSALLAKMRRKGSRA